MSHMHLGRFLLTRVEQQVLRARGTDHDTHELDICCTRDALICRPVGRLLHKEQYLRDQRVIIRVSRLQQVWLTLCISTGRTTFL